MKVDKNLSPLITTKKWFKRYLVGALMFVLYPFILGGGGMHLFFTPTMTFLKAPQHPDWYLLSSEDTIAKSYGYVGGRTGRGYLSPGFKPLSKTTVNNYFDLVEDIISTY